MKNDFYVLQIENEPSPIAIIKCKSGEFPDCEKVCNAINQHFDAENTDVVMVYNAKDYMYDGTAIVTLEDGDKQEYTLTLISCQVY